MCYIAIYGNPQAYAAANWVNHNHSNACQHRSVYVLVFVKPSTNNCCNVLWCTTGRRQHQLPTTPLTVNGVPVLPVCDLGVYIDADLVMRTHVQRTVSRCFAILRQLRQIRHAVPTRTFQTLVVSLVLSRLDYENAVLVGLPTCSTLQHD